MSKKNIIILGLFFGLILAILKITLSFSLHFVDATTNIILFSIILSILFMTIYAKINTKKDGLISNFGIGFDYSLATLKIPNILYLV